MNHTTAHLHHFLSVDNLTQEILSAILNKAQAYIDADQHTSRKLDTLRDKTIANLFFEPSTRTRCSFELAAKRLGADVLALDSQFSSTVKGETLLDTVRTLEAMHVNCFVIRHPDDDAINFIAQHVNPDTAIVNAGAGQHAHPTQAMLDLLTIRQKKPDFANLSVAIVGDILHSRVARSDIRVLETMGVKDIRAIGPKNLIPDNLEALGVKVFHQINEGLADVDVIIMLRIQKERIQNHLLLNIQDYYQSYGLTENRLALAKPDAIVLHPGPINRGVEISSAVADCSKSLILNQIANSVAVRMAIFTTLLKKNS